MDKLWHLDHPRLPPELQLMVLKELNDDPNTLSACSLVTRAWLSTTRPFLFRDITLTANKHTAHRFTDFLQFFQEHPTSGLGSQLAQYIESLDVYGELVDLPKFLEDEDHEDREYHVPCMLKTIRQIILILPRLRDVSVEHISLVDKECLRYHQRYDSESDTSESDLDDDLPPRVITPPPPPPLPCAPASGPRSNGATLNGSARPSIRCLILTRCSAPHGDIRVLFTLVSLFKSIGTLNIECLSWARYEDPFEVLSSLPQFPSITAVELSQLSEHTHCVEMIEEMSKMLSSQGRPLQSLTMETDITGHIADLFSWESHSLASSSCLVEL
ncbi:hypothetical protein C8Q80DRAFT_368358 [Daedaleopsis nitida]|nr:hypothetical protein C8Q80DRAFT_368358 [Daedaleopsis nitida]